MTEELVGCRGPFVIVRVNKNMFEQKYIYN